jgi:predicted nucleic acid-binding protein
LSTYVLDASVAAKWMLPSGGESLHAEALAWLTRYTNGELTLIVPDLFWIEVGNVLWRAVRCARLTKLEAQLAMAGLQGREIETMSTTNLIDTALEIAITYQRTMYDSIYVALAKQQETYLVTADEKLANAVAAYLPVKWLGAI